MWDRRDTMNVLWDEEVPFISLFDGHHLFYILLMTILLLLLITQYRFVQENANQVSRWILAASLAQQILLYSWYIFETGFDISESLPLHISRISSLLGIAFLITKNNKILDVLFYFGLFAYGTFFWPQRVYPVYHAIGVSFFVNHAITILLPIFAAIAYDWRPKLHAVFKAYGWFLLYFVVVYFLNPLIDGNYFYLKYRPFLAHLPDYIYVLFALLGTFLVFLIGFSLAKLIEQLVIKKPRKLK